MTTALLIELAWKSTLTLGATLIILRLLRHRSAAERSWLAHAGLLVTLLLPVVLLAAPRWQVEAPAPVADMLAAAPAETPTTALPDPSIRLSGEGRNPAQASDWVPASAGTTTESVNGTSRSTSLPTTVLVYAGPAALLLTLTLVAIFRLVGLRRRASVLVENSWLSALAQAQRRMGFKHGTALLVSRDIESPVSWGLLRPVILLNEAAIGSKDQAEAIIAHELAHVARLDWAKLLLARVTAALFWFNPLVWVLTKQCHQLREESADDAVLASDVPDLDYAELLVGVARHESGALLLAANGVAPSRGSLAQRVQRVLDTSRRRAPARFGWGAACTLGASLFAAPLAALSLAVETPAAPVRLAVAPAPVAPLMPPAARRAPAALAPAPAATPVATNPFAVTPVAAPVTVTALAAAPAAAPAAAALPIGLPPFSSISLRGGGQVILRHGRSSGVRVVSGNADNANFAVAGDSLAIDGCHGDCRNLVLEVTVPRLDAIAIEGGGSIEARGAFPAMPELAVAISNGGTVDVRAIPTDEVAAAIQKGGRIDTTARRELAASIRGGGAIRYWGDPEVATAVSGGGSVERGGQ